MTLQAETIQHVATTHLYWHSLPSPMGACVIMATDTGICWAGTPGTPVSTGLAWVKRHLHSTYLVEDGMNAALQHAVEQMELYLSGECVQFSCPLDLRGTPFQVSVWQILSTIPYGETRTYGEIARAVGRPTASRAVGAANGANPLAIIVPCHRVIGSSGSLTGYGGGLPTKKWLLELEGALAG